MRRQIIRMIPSIEENHRGSVFVVFLLMLLAHWATLKLDNHKHSSVVQYSRFKLCGQSGIKKSLFCVKHTDVKPQRYAIFNCDVFATYWSVLKHSCHNAYKILQKYYVHKTLYFDLQISRLEIKILRIKTESTALL